MKGISSNPRDVDDVRRVMLWKLEHTVGAESTVRQFEGGLELRCGDVTFTVTEGEEIPVRKTPMHFRADLRAKLKEGLGTYPAQAEPRITTEDAAAFFVDWLADPDNTATLRHLLETLDGGTDDAALVRKYVTAMEAEIAELRKKAASDR